MTASASAVRFSEKERADVRELFRIYDFSKFGKVDEVVAELESQGRSPATFFDDMFALYRVRRLPDREGVRQRMRQAVPAASDEDIECVLRQTEMHRFAEKDAIRSLERLYKVSRAIRPPSRPSGTPPSLVLTAARWAHPRTSASPTATVAAVEDAVTSPPGLPDSPPRDCGIPTAPPQQPIEGVTSSSGNAVISSSCYHSSTLAGGQRADGGGPGRQTSLVDYTPLLASLSSEVHRVASNLRRVTVNETSSGSLYGSGTFPPRAGFTGVDHRSPPCPPHDMNGSSGMLSMGHSRQAVDEVMAEEVREWIAKMVGDTYNKDVLAKPNFVDALRSGVVLQVLLQKMQVPPVPDAELKVPRRTTGFYARDNVANFLAEARERFKLVDAQLFSNTDLCDGKDDRAVATCLMSIARIAYTTGAIKYAPTVVMLEKDIEARTGRVSKEEVERLVEEAKSRESASGGADREGAGVTPDRASEDVVRVSEPSRTQLTTPPAAPTRSASDEPQRTTPTQAGSGADEVAAQRVAEGSEAAGHPPPTRTAPVMEELSGMGEDREIGGGLAHGYPGISPPSDALSEPAGTRTPVEEVPKLVGKRKVEWETKIIDDSRGGEVPERRGDAPKQKITRVVWKVPVSDPSVTEGKTPYYRSRRWDGIDVALGNIVNAYYKENPTSPWRFHAMAAHAGEYIMYHRDTAQKKVVFVRFIQRRLFIRYSQGPTGPQWVLFSDAVEQLEDLFSKQPKIC